MSIMSKAFLKSMKLMYTGDCHSNDCSSMMLNVAIWSLQDLPALKPACSSLNVLFTAAFSLASSILVRTLLGLDRSWMPLQLWQSSKSPFLGSLTIWPVFHSVGISSFSQMSWSSSCIIRAYVAVSALRASGGMLSGPEAFPTLLH